MTTLSSGLGHLLNVIFPAGSGFFLWACIFPFPGRFVRLLKRIFTGKGSPEGNIGAPPGSLYLRDDEGNGPVFWVKRTGPGKTGWKDVPSLEIINVRDFGAVGDGKADDTAALKAAIQAAGANKIISNKIIWFEPGRNYKTTETLTINQYGVIIEGNGATIEYYGGGSAVEIGPEKTLKRYVVNCRITSLFVTLHIGDVAWDIKASHSIFTKLFAGLRQNGQICYRLWGDGKGGTGSYYNLFIGCNAQGTANTGKHDQTGWYFKYEEVANHPGYFHYPNANRWFGGRTGQCAIAYRINGENNVLYSPIAEGNTEKVFWFEHPHHHKHLGCDDNQVYSPYVEGAAGTTVVHVDENCLRAMVLHPFITAVKGGPFLVDNGKGTVFILAGHTTQIPAHGHTLIMPTAPELPTVSGPYPGYAFKDPNNNTTVIVRNASASKHPKHLKGSIYRYFEVAQETNGKQVVLFQAGTSYARLKAEHLILGAQDELTSTDGAVGIYTGKGIPQINAPDGSLFLRTDGGTLYVRKNGAWVAK